MNARQNTLDGGEIALFCRTKSAGSQCRPVVGAGYGCLNFSRAARTGTARQRHYLLKQQISFIFYRNQTEGVYSVRVAN
jgi:hypothetical protein